MHEKKIAVIIEALERIKPCNCRAFIGFDGFVDEVVHVVKKRLDAQNYQREETLAGYGERITATAGYSSNMEIVSIAQKIGGNGPILANALVNFGVEVGYLGALGYPAFHPVFRPMIEKMSPVFSVAEPASTDAVEFYDGKIIRSKLSAFDELNFENIKLRIGLDKVLDALAAATLIGFVNWTLVYNSSDIWNRFLLDLLPLLGAGLKEKFFFFDLADPAARSDEDIRAILGIIKGYAEQCRVILGLNLREAVHIARIISLGADKAGNDLQELCKVISGYLGVYAVVVHPVKESCCQIAGKFYHEVGRYCEKPVLTTGAGDNFNAGFVLGLMLKLSPELALILGMAASGYYVRTGRSGKSEDICAFLCEWQKEAASSYK